MARLAALGRRETRSTVQRWIDHGCVTVRARVLASGGTPRASSAVPAGARVEVRPELPEATTAEPDASVALCVVYEDAHLLVIDKPAGLVVHPARGHATGTLVNGLLAHGGFERRLSDEGADPRDPVSHLRPGIVHRLDKDTSGLLVVARDWATREGLKAQFAKHTIEREYLAIAIGAAEDRTLSSLYARCPNDPRRFTSRVSSGRHAVTHVRVLERLPAATVVACRLETGRTHQIRVHMTEIAGTPILGDQLYGHPPREPWLRALGEQLGRQALHARALGFVHPATGKAVRWESPLPPDIARVLAALRARRG